MCRYGFIPTLQPTSNFGRLYAIYGGFFIVLSYGWGWVVDGEKPDRGDFLGASIAIVAWRWLTSGRATAALSSCVLRCPVHMGGTRSA